jgi:transposase
MSSERSRTQTISRRLEKLRQKTQRGQLHGRHAIGLRVGKVVNKHKVAKHFQLDISDDGLQFRIDDEKVAAEAALDGIYVIRTSLPTERMSSEDTVRSYKLLSNVERAFKSFKTIDLKVRPIRHRLETRVRAHIFLCMLAYYVEWHMLEAWRPLLFSDEEQEAKRSRDPVAPARRSDSAERKVHTKRLENGAPVESFHTLMDSLSTIVRNKCRRYGAAPDEETFDLDTPPDARQSRAYSLLTAIEVPV